MVIKNKCICSDCKKEFFLEDAKWCIHKEKLNIGTKKCPNCGTCICNGETVDEIMKRFNNNISIGKFVKVKKSIKGTNWNYQCKTIVQVEVKE
jgi:hypothetical protein